MCMYNAKESAKPVNAASRVRAKTCLTVLTRDGTNISSRQTYSLMHAIFDFTVELFENSAPAYTVGTDKLSSKKTRSSHYFMQMRSSTCDRTGDRP